MAEGNNRRGQQFWVLRSFRKSFYYFLKFEASGDAIAEIESRMRIMDNVLRYLCVKQDEA